MMSGWFEVMLREGGGGDEKWRADSSECVEGTAVVELLCVGWWRVEMSRSGRRRREGGGEVMVSCSSRSNGSHRSQSRLPLDRLGTD